ncbi:MAG: N-acetylneuraminate synthase family protein, partial [Candidatus Omnitrophica bacterium]|nr:N-acetylneuraminate synthase family protein [Candidatus Omnitrophota bacterium]
MNIHEIGKTNHVWIIAEAGSNWRMGTPERDLGMAKALIDVAAQAGCDAVKFQTYRAHTVYVPNAGESDYLAEAGFRASIPDIFRDLSMPYEMIPLLAEYCKKKKIEFMSSPFSVSDLEAVDPYVRIHKIASYEINHVRLLEAVAKTKKPVFVSTGASRLEDIEFAVHFLKERGSGQVYLMQCTAKYPAPPESLNLAVIPELYKKFNLPVGLSDHSRHPVYAPVASVALGACAIEKHFTLDNRLPGPDHPFALTPSELAELVQAVRSSEKLRGSGEKKVSQWEEELRQFAHRALQALVPIKKGDLFREGINFDILRPGKQRQGAHPRFVEKVSGKHALR